MIKDQLIFRREGEVYLRCEVTLMANPEMDILVLLCAAHCWVDCLNSCKPQYVQCALHELIKDESLFSDIQGLF